MTTNVAYAQMCFCLPNQLDMELNFPPERKDIRISKRRNKENSIKGKTTYIC